MELVTYRCAYLQGLRECNPFVMISMPISAMFGIVGKNAARSANWQPGLHSCINKKLTPQAVDISQLQESDALETQSKAVGGGSFGETPLLQKTYRGLL
ncbi:hypothetical protein [Pseudorhodobacter sp.]|uniref:hypothetical protein n=1 Tax=Pseudorhodobacter sp. TaxID=1934400 RepID=UPI002AFFCDD5|nr:hypothetical protein [Pseudorhodobacter sp.]